MCQVVLQGQDQGGKTVFPQCEQSPRENPAMKINHFEGNGPKWLVPKRIFCFWQRTRPLEGERGSTYWCMSAILCSPFFILSFQFFLSFLFIFFLSICLFCCDYLLEITTTLSPPLPLLCMARVLYIMPVVTSFYHFSL